MWSPNGKMWNSNSENVESIFWFDLNESESHSHSLPCPGSKLIEVFVYLAVLVILSSKVTLRPRLTGKVHVFGGMCPGVLERSAR